jgi:hypothetical protein
MTWTANYLACTEAICRDRGCVGACSLNPLPLAAADSDDQHHGEGQVDAQLPE